MIDDRTSQENSFRNDHGKCIIQHHVSHVLIDDINKNFMFYDSIIHAFLINSSLNTLRFVN